jgi:hypothetical protein
LTSTPGGTHASGIGPPASRSSPVKTAATPGRSRAADASIEVIFAWACGERTNATQSVPGSAMSST